MSNFEVESKQVINLFSKLTSRKKKQSYKTALRRAAGILTKETRKQLKKVIGKAISHRNKWNNKTLGSGIRVKVNKEGTDAKVHLMGDFRLKFFETGTKKRKLKKNGANRGKIKSSYFFRTAKENKEQEIFSSMNKLVIESIQKVASKRK